MPSEPGSEPTEAPALSERLSAISSAPAVRSAALTGLFLIAFATVLYIGRSIFIPITLALLFSFVLSPLVSGMARIGIPRGLGATVVMGALVFAVGYAGLRFADPVADWVDRLPRALSTLEQKSRSVRAPVKEVSDLAERVERITKVDSPKTPVRTVQVEQKSATQLALAYAGEVLAGTVVMMVSLYFMLIWGEGLLERLMGLSPQLRGQQIVREVQQRMGQYMGTIFAINVCLGVAVGACLHLLEMPNAALWGVVAAVLNFVPYLGGLAGVGIVALAAIVSYPTLSQAALPPLAYFAITALEGNLITPLIIGRAFRVSPLVVFIWLVLWAWLWGVAGALVAVPLLMLVKITSERSPALAPLAALLQR